MPPRAIILKFVALESWLNLTTPIPLFFFVLKIGDIKMKSTPCFSLILSSFKLCAEPRIKKFLFFLFFLINKWLKDGR